jgi:hypothetical protein
MAKSNCDRLRENIKALEDKWKADLKTNKAGGNSGDNMKLLKLRNLLKLVCNGNNKKK